eukprot:jgi/Tetstr1/441703/TSEL_029926.t1
MGYSRNSAGNNLNVQQQDGYKYALWEARELELCAAGQDEAAAGQAANEALQAEVERLQAQLAAALEAGNQLKAAEDKSVALQASYDALYEKYAAATAAHEESTAKHSALEESHRALEDHLAGSKSSYDALQKELTAAQTALAEAAEKHAVLEASYRQMQDHYTAAQAAKGALQERNAELLAAAEAASSAGSQLEALQQRVRELEEAWTPLWVQTAAEDAMNRSQAAADIAAQKAQELYSQGQALGVEYATKARKSTIVADAQDKAAHYGKLCVEKSKEGLAFLQAQWLVVQTKAEPLLAEASSHIAQIHTELVHFLQPRMAANAALRPYSDTAAVRKLVTAMMASPFVALAVPPLLWMLSCLCGSSRKASRAESAKPAKANKEQPSSKASGSGKKSKKSDAASPVQHGPGSYVTVGGERVKYGKPVKL